MAKLHEVPLSVLSLCEFYILAVLSLALLVASPSVISPLILSWANKAGVYDDFPSDPSPIIGFGYHWLTNFLTNSCLVDLNDVTLVCEDAKSKPVQAVTVADVDVRTILVHRLLQICSKAKTLLSL